MKCNNCGYEAPYGRIYCPKCGSRMSEDESYNRTIVCNVIKRISYPTFYLILFICSFFDWISYEHFFGANPYSFLYFYNAKSAHIIEIIFYSLVLLFLALAIIYGALGKYSTRNGCGLGAVICSFIVYITTRIDLDHGSPGFSFWVNVILGIFFLTPAIDTIIVRIAYASKRDNSKFETPMHDDYHFGPEKIVIQNMTTKSATIECLQSRLITDMSNAKYVENIFRNISSKPFTYIDIDIYGLDYNGYQTESILQYPYQGFFLWPGCSCGQDFYIPLTNPNTVDYCMFVNRVIFSDGSVWERNGEPWEASEWNSSVGFDFFACKKKLYSFNNSPTQIYEFFKQNPSEDNKYKLLMTELENLIAYEKYYGIPQQDVVSILEQKYIKLTEQ